MKKLIALLFIVAFLGGCLEGCTDNHSTTYSGSGAGTTGNGNTVQVGNTTNNPAPVVVTPVVVTNP